MSSYEKEEVIKNNFFNQFKHERHIFSNGSSNKSILRQPKLLFPFSSKSSSDGPFSLSFNTNDNVSKLGKYYKLYNQVFMVCIINRICQITDTSTIFGTPSTSNCNICGTSINYKLTQKTMKFGITCCNDCRRFISSMNKKMAVVGLKSDFRLVCSKGEGMKYRYLK